MHKSRHTLAKDIVDEREESTMDDGGVEEAFVALADKKLARAERHGEAIYNLRIALIGGARALGHGGVAYDSMRGEACTRGGKAWCAP